MLKKASKRISQQLSDLQRAALVEKLSMMHSTFSNEFKKQTILAISAAFGFLIALVWRDYLMSIIKTEQLTLLSVVIITAMCVLGLIIISKWAVTENK